MFYAPDVAHKERLFRGKEDSGEVVKVLRKTVLGFVRGWFEGDEGKGSSV